jgi:uncharacterized membrane-anchored protein
MFGDYNSLHENDSFSGLPLAECFNSTEHTAMKCIPKINRTYWAALILASVFGANAGDFLADALHLGHLNGIPYLAVCLLVVFLIERFVSRPSALYFWATIIIIRASATNIGDVFHDHRISFAYSVPLVTLLLFLAITIWRFVRAPPHTPGVVPVNGFYWLTMFFAGVLGTLIGDAMSYAAGLGNLGATLVLSVPLAIALFVGRRGLLTQLYFYWFTVVLIRSAGTAAGDLLAHKYLGLTGATAASGAIFIAFVLFSYLASTGNVRLATTSPPE